ncbi:MAG: flagellar biosynthetic protein FlhB [Betaproteobacteria bacterium HGW-Betaproteobacteria-8]|jgi:flagellar biosynthetic protein FlhB|nr:MAG: flagellar biosynthetic protein FlhB [Betaproteobacteria bacterium HGW-Betaproteobacteria-8]PKO93130.1 MAG: flagellar biosynthetic protein FlhB [Betaproteobacteria bacterium HGW-Betaproteobacteria-1]
MAEDSDLEKTEQATPKRIEKAREDGDVPRSKELATVSVLLTMLVGIWASGAQLTQALKTNMAAGLTLPRNLVFEPGLLIVNISQNLGELLWAFLPLAGLVVFIAIASPVLLGGWNVSSKALIPKFNKLNPLSGIKNLVSKNAAMEFFKAVVKATLVGSVAFFVVAAEIDDVLMLPLLPVNEALTSTAYLILVTMIAITGSLVLIAAVDVPYQLWSYANKLKMTKQDVRQESKETEGNPEIKARIRLQQREMARRRMMAEIPNADVVVTNPTHYAVAIQYKNDSMRAPVVVAKGADAIALKIREIAAEHKVSVLESPKLARALYAHTDLGDAIPEALYAAVAEVLAYVYQMRIFKKDGGLQPRQPDVLEVPDELDPHALAGASA